MTVKGCMATKPILIIMRPRIKAVKVKSTMDYMKPIEIVCKMLNLKNELKWDTQN